MPRRQGITLEQRRALRLFYHGLVPRPSQKRCIQWFHDSYGQRISLSTVSVSVNQRFAWLDDKPVGSGPTEQRQRIPQGQWSDLEIALLQWHKLVESRGGVTSQDLLRAKARQIWNRLPQYHDLDPPGFSNGWLYRFQTRHNIQHRVQHDEAGSVPEAALQAMVAIRTLAGEYKEEDIYNMDETGLYWKKTPSQGLTTEGGPGVKKDNARISIAFCTNATGMDRTRLWFVGRTKTPRALKHVSLATMGTVWRWNTTAQMTSAIMQEWLSSFYQHVGTTRKILLTLDSCSAHVAAISLAPPPSNVRICWLPPNATSKFQPLDQGIIKSFKAHYQRQWLKYMVDGFVRNEDPTKSINIHLAIRWSTRAWNHDMSNSTIYNSFRRSAVISNSIDLPSSEALDLKHLYEQVVELGGINDAMPFSTFVNPEEGAIINNLQDLNNSELLHGIIGLHAGHEASSDNEDTLEPPGQPPHTVQEAIHHCQCLIEYIECQDQVGTSYLRQLESLEKILINLKASEDVQGSLDSWIP